MGLFLRILVIVFEIIYYSLFMKQARKEGKLTRYLLLFTLFSIVSFFMNDSSLISYAMILMMILYGLKYVVKLNISLYDLFFIIIILLFKLLIELLFAFVINHFINDILVSKVILGLIKILFVIVVGFGLNNLYNKLYKYWNENRFFIRYIFDILLFIYIIASCLFLIKFR